MLPKGDRVDFEVRFKEEGGEWGGWQAIEEEDDLKEDPPDGLSESQKAINIFVEVIWATACRLIKEIERQSLIVKGSLT